MPNWCYNSEVIAGPKEEVKPLYDNLVKWVHKDICPNGFSNGWLGNIVGWSGIESCKNPGEWKYPCRGELSDDFDYSEDGDESIIQFSTETAWGPFPETWYAIVQKYAPGARYYFMADEPNMAIYESNDINHRFFSEEFVVSYGFYDKENLKEPYLTEFKDMEDDISWDWDPDEVIGMMERITGMKIEDYNNDEELDKLIRVFEEKTSEDLGDGDNYLYVYKVKYYDSKI